VSHVPVPCAGRCDGMPGLRKAHRSYGGGATGSPSALAVPSAAAVPAARSPARPSAVDIRLVATAAATASTATPAGATPATAASSAGAERPHRPV